MTAGTGAGGGASGTTLAQPYVWRSRTRIVFTSWKRAQGAQQHERRRLVAESS